MTARFCVLSIVDNRTFKRLSTTFGPRPVPSRRQAFFRRFRQALEARGLTVQGITTDGSTLYPEPYRRSSVRCRIRSANSTSCTRLNKAVLLGRGPGTQASGGRCPQIAAGPSQLKGGQACRSARSGSSRRWVSCSRTATCSSSRRLSPSERATLQRISRGWPQLRSPARADGGGLPVVRSTVPDGYGVWQGNSSIAGAERLGLLRNGFASGAGVPGCAWAARARVNAVERGNRRYPRWQKTVYRVRTQRAIEGRLAWTCCGSSTPKAGLRPPRFCTRRGRHDAIARYPCYSLNSYSRFGPATADRGSRGIRDQPRNPPKYTEKRIRINFPFPCPCRRQPPPVGWGRSVVTRL